MGQYRLFPFIMALFVAVLLISNIAAGKIVYLFGISITGGVLLFPISYIFGDVLTEVYGYRRSRIVIWTGFVANLLMAGALALVGALPGDPFWVAEGGQEHWDFILGQTPRIVAGSLAAYWAGEFLNSYVLARMKVWTQGRWLWARTIGSTLVGEGVDTAIFVLVAFTGVLPWTLMQKIMVANYLAKVGMEVALTPVTYLVVGWLKRVENSDVYDRDTNFNPFRLELDGGTER